MRPETGQFGSFDGLDNRRTVMELFDRMGWGVSELEGMERRRDAVLRLIRFSGNGFADKMVHLDPLSTVEAYFAFTAVTGCLDVDVELAAKELENEIREKRYDRRDLARR